MRGILAIRIGTGAAAWLLSGLAVLAAGAGDLGFIVAIVPGALAVSAAATFTRYTRRQPAGILGPVVCSLGRAPAFSRSVWLVR